MRTPKESWLTSGHSSAFAKIVASESFEPACDYALLQLQSEMPPTTVPGTPSDPYIALDANSQMFGAKRVMAILQSLSEPIKPPTKTKEPTIYHSRD
jgi:hypothetical protein